MISRTQAEKPRATHWDGAGIFCVLALLLTIMEYIPEENATLE